jgi:PAS domain S-box-containing protein
VTPGHQVTDLWSVADGRLLVVSSAPAIEAAFPHALPSTGAGVRLDQTDDHTIVSSIAEAVRASDTAAAAVLGYVVVRRPVSSGTQSDALSRLMGAGARLELGGRGAERWTDLTTLVPAPPIDPPGTGYRQYRSADGEDRLGALSAVAGTPWLVWVSFPRAPVATQARGFVEDMALIALLFVILAGLGSAVVTSRIVGPLSVLTSASEAIAAGDYARRVSEVRPDEIGRLGAAFNAMVRQIQEGHERLIERARHATCLAEVANAVTEGGPVRDVLQRCAAATVQHLPAAHVSIWTVHAAEPVLERLASVGPVSPFDLAYESLPVGHSEIGLVAKTQTPLVAEDVRAHPDLRHRLWPKDGDALGCAAYPLVVNEQLVGVMATCAPAPLTDRTREALVSVARTIAVGIARKQLEDSRAQLANILDAASDFVTIGQPDGPPMYLNRAVRRALEIGEAEGVDSLLAFRPPVFRTHFKTVVLPAADRDGSWRGETEYMSRSGRVIPVSQVSVVHRDASGGIAYLSTIARDISDQRRAETALRDSEARFRRIAETITEVFWIADVGLSRMVYVSPGYERVWGRTCESLYQNPSSFLDAVHEGDRPRVLATFQRQPLGRPFDHEYRIVKPDGELRWIWDRGFPVADESGRVMQYVGAAQDITDRKRADERMRLLARAIESTNEMVSVTDMDDRFTFVNRAFLETYGYSMDELIGQTHALVRPLEGADDLFGDVSRETRRGGWQGEVPNRRKDGTQLLVSLNTSLIRDDAGQTIGTLGVARDITARRSLEDQLRQSQKMEAVGQLAGGIAHDFNNLLTAIHGYAGLLTDSLPEADERRGDVDQIRQAAERAAALTKQLLAFSRKQILAPRVLRLGDVVGELIPMLRRLLGEAVDLKTVLAERGSVKADTGQLEQVLVNLAVNARDAMPKGGHLTIETTDVIVDNAYSRRHAGVRPGPHVVLAVSDSGHGMDAATQQRVFEPFFTTKPVGQGTGLGLATVHGIVTQSGGHIWVYSEVNRGTTFKVYLPRTDEVAEAETPIAAEPSAVSADETILLIEDESAVREFARRVLTLRGYTIHAMGEPTSALEFARAHRGSIQLVLTDVVLPGMNGRDLAGRLQEHHPESRVLFMSGYTDDAIVHHGVLDPGMWFLQKPFTATALLARVRDLLDA